MQIHFNKIRDFVYKVNLDIRADYANIIASLEKETWFPDQGAYGQSNFVSRYYLNWDQVQNTYLQEIQDWSCSDDFRRSVIDQLYSEPNFAGYWSIDPETMFRTTVSSGRFLKDLPGFGAGVHIDNRLQVAAGMIYFIDGDDENQSTTFYSTPTGADPCRIPTGHGHGWIAANMHDSWHDGWNRSAQNRYSLILSLGLKIHR
jgi:hypothetical protein